METTQNTTLESLKKDVFEYLTHLNNNQIRGFYDWNGYWKKKEELELKPDQKTWLKELHEYMCSISTYDIVKESVKSGKEWLSKYGRYGSGRKSDSQHYATTQATATVNSKHVKENFKILTRTRLFVGFYIGVFNEGEVINLIKETRESELNSTFYTHRKSQISNAIFRMEILYSFLKGSQFDELCLNELKELSRMQLDYLKTEENKILNIAAYKEELQPIQGKINVLKNKIALLNEDKKSIELRISELQKTVGEINKKYNISDFSQAARYM